MKIPYDVLNSRRKLYTEYFPKKCLGVSLSNNNLNLANEALIAIHNPYHNNQHFSLRLHSSYHNLHFSC